MLRLNFQAGYLVFLGLNLNACLPQSIQGNLGKNNHSEFRAVLPEKTIFGDSTLQAKITEYQLKIKHSEVTQENCKDLEPISNSYETKNLSASIIKSCAYKITLSIGETKNSNFITYYAGEASLSAEDTKGDSTNVSLKIFRTEAGKAAGFLVGENTTPPPTPNSTDLSIQVEMGRGAPSTNPNNNNNIDEPVSSNHSVDVKKILDKFVFEEDARSHFVTKCKQEKEINIGCILIDPRVTAMGNIVREPKSAPNEKGIHTYSWKVEQNSIVYRLQFTLSDTSNKELVNEISQNRIRELKLTNFDITSPSTIVGVYQKN